MDVQEAIDNSIDNFFSDDCDSNDLSGMFCSSETVTDQKRIAHALSCWYQLVKFAENTMDKDGKFYLNFETETKRACGQFLQNGSILFLTHLAPCNELGISEEELCELIRLWENTENGLQLICPGEKQRYYDIFGKELRDVDSSRLVIVGNRRGKLHMKLMLAEKFSASREEYRQRIQQIFSECIEKSSRN